MLPIATPLLLAQANPPMWPIFVIIGVMFYLMILAPERRKRAAHSQMLETLKKNDRVVTIGGIYGTVVNVQADDVTLRVDEATNARIRVMRSSISRVLVDDDGKDKKGRSPGRTSEPAASESTRLST